MYRFAVRPAWLLSHLLVLVLVVVMVNLGFWQLRRLDERQDRNQLVESRAELAALDGSRLAALGPEEARFRSVAAGGRYLEDATVAIDNRTRDGRPGAWLLTAFELDGGAVVMANRGFLPYGEGLALEAPPQPATTRLAGRASPGASRSCAGAAADDAGVAFRYACVDLERIGSDLGRELLPVEVRLPESEAASLSAVPPPELDDGPHLSYAVQWFIFSTIAVVGYPVVLRRVAHQRAREARAEADLDRELRTLVEEHET